MRRRRPWQLVRVRGDQARPGRRDAGPANAWHDDDNDDDETDPPTHAGRPTIMSTTRMLMTETTNLIGTHARTPTTKSNLSRKRGECIPSPNTRHANGNTREKKRTCKKQRNKRLEGDRTTLTGASTGTRNSTLLGSRTHRAGRTRTARGHAGRPAAAFDRHKHYTMHTHTDRALARCYSR